MISMCCGARETTMKMMWPKWDAFLRSMISGSSCSNFVKFLNMRGAFKLFFGFWFSSFSTSLNLKRLIYWSCCLVTIVYGRLTSCCNHKFAQLSGAHSVVNLHSACARCPYSMSGTNLSKHNLFMCGTPACTGLHKHD